MRLGRLKDGEQQAAVAGKRDSPPEERSVVQQTLGLNLANLTNELRRRYKIKDSVNGVVITDVDSNSEAEKRLKPGDVIDLAQEAVASAADVQKRIDQLKKEARKSALLLVANAEGDLRYVTLTLKYAAEKVATEKAAADTRRAEEDAARLDPALSVQPGSGRSFRDRLANGQPCPTCPEMVVVPKGKFTMGSPKSEPQRESDEEQVSVSIAKPFAVGKFAVTRGEFAAFVEETGHKADDGCRVWSASKWEFKADNSWRAPGFAQDDRHPVVCVNWNDAKAYAEWLSRKTGKTYRLLSETEREYVARAGTATPFWWGISITPKQANYNGNLSYAGGGSTGEYRQRTVPVDSFEPNPWGLYNVHGNVWDWTKTLETVVAVSFAAVPGTAIHRASAPPVPSGAPPTSGATGSVSGSGGRLPLESLPLYPLGPGRTPGRVFFVFLFF